MSGRHGTSYQRLASGGRPHWDVVSNLLAMQARLRGEGEPSGHPAGTARPAPGESPGSGSGPAGAGLAEVIRLPRATAYPVENPPSPTPSPVTPSEDAAPEDVAARLDRLEAGLAALLDRLGPAPATEEDGSGSVEGAIVRLQRAVDRRLGAPS